MFSRRQFLLGSTSIVGVTLPQPAAAIVQAIVAAAAAITAVALALSEAADALDKVIQKGITLSRTIAGELERYKAARDIAETKAEMRAAMEIRRQVISQGQSTKIANARVISDARYFIVVGTASSWDSFRTTIQRALDDLLPAARLFREKAHWFPPEAQEILAAIPSLYERRASVLVEVKHGLEHPPLTPDERAAFSQLVDNYDELRIAAMKMLNSLDAYMT